MLRVDPEKIEAELAAFLEREGPKALQPGFPGVVARAQIALLPTITRWRVQEMNRLGADPNEVANALVMMIASTLTGEAMSVYGQEANDEHFSFINNMLRGIGEECGALLTRQIGGVQYHHHKPEQSGTA
jgi:hypothetical protein